MGGRDRLVAMAKIGVGQKVQDLVRTCAADDAVGVETEGAADPARFGGTDSAYNAGRMSFVQIRYSGFILGNNTGSTGNVTSFATSSLFGTGIGGQVLAWNNGVAQWIASTTYASPLSFSGGQVSCSSCATFGFPFTPNASHFRP